MASSSSFLEKYSDATSKKASYLWVGKNRDKCPKAYLPLFDAIKTEKIDLIERIELTPERVLKEWMAIAFYNPQNFLDPETGKPIPIHELPPEIACGIRECQTFRTEDVIETEIKGPDGNIVGVATKTTVKHSAEFKGFKKEEALKFLSLYLGMVSNPRSNSNQSIPPGRLPRNSEQGLISQVLKKIDGNTRGLPEPVSELPGNIKYVNDEG